MLNYSHIFCLLHLVSLFSSTFFLCLPFHLKKSFSPPPSIPLPTLSLSMINVQGQKSEEQCVVARLGARTQAITQSHEDKWLHYLTFSPLVCNCMSPPTHPPSLSQNPILLCAPPIFPHLFIISLHKKALSFFFNFLFLLKHINRLNLTRFFVVLMNNFVMNMY